MRKLVGFVAAVIAFLEISTPINADVIALYGDSLRADCDVPYAIVMPVYVFHYSAAGATESSFRALYQSCLAEIEHLNEGSVSPQPGIRRMA